MDVGVETYDVLIVDPEAETRMLLRQATAAAGQFRRITATASLHDMQAKLEGEDLCDVVFVSCRFAEKDVVEFVQRAKQTPQGQDAAYILVVNSEHQDSSTVARGVVTGIDGFLFEPYSVEYVIEIADIAARIKKEREEARRKLALSILLKDMIKLIDVAAYLSSMGIKPVKSMRRMREMGETLAQLSPEALDSYHEMAVDEFIAAPLPRKRTRAKDYKGASAAVRRKLEQKDKTPPSETEKAKLRKLDQ